MAVSNRIQQQLPSSRTIEYKVGEETVKLSPTIVRNYLVNGDGNVTDQEVAMFVNLCKYQRLNPLIRDAYLIKYGDQPATIVTSKDAVMKRAMRNPKYAGHQAGIIVMTRGGELDYRVGAYKLPGETIIGGWAKTYVKGYEVPIEVAVSFDEYAGRKRDGSLNSTWAGKPGVMIRKVALTTSLREAFPEDLQGMYAPEEMGGAEDAMTPAMDLIEQPEPPRQRPEVQQPPQAPVAEMEAQQPTETLVNLNEDLAEVNLHEDLQGIF